jgi:hypothetical protein
MFVGMHVNCSFDFSGCVYLVGIEDELVLSW